MTLTDLIVLALAVAGAVDAWFNGDLFAEWRATLQGYQDANSDNNWGLLCQLFLCPYCLSYHVAFWVVVTWYLADWWPLLKLPIYALAIVRLAWLAERLLPTALHYDRWKELP